DVQPDPVAGAPVRQLLDEVRAGAQRPSFEREDHIAPLEPSAIRRALRRHDADRHPRRRPRLRRAIDAEPCPRRPRRRRRLRRRAGPRAIVAAVVAAKEVLQQPLEPLALTLPLPLALVLTRPLAAVALLSERARHVAQRLL